MMVLEFVRQLAFDLEAGARAEDCVWASVVENMDEDADDWIHFESSEEMYRAFGLTKEGSADAGP